MSNDNIAKISIIEGNSIETVGGTYTEYVGNTTYSSGQKLFVTAVDGKYFGSNPEDMPSANLVKYYVKVRIKDMSSYDGKFGFDWVDINPTNKEIEKIQDVDFSNVEYFYKAGATANDLGDIIQKSTDEAGAKLAIEKNYGTPLFPCTNGYVDMPFVLIKPNQQISLSLEVNVPTNETLTEEVIYLTSDEYYKFEIVGGVTNGNRTEKKISANGEKLELKITCLQESPQKKYKILQESPTVKMMEVGGFTMMENKVLKLKFRVIALVSSDASPNDKAKALFKKFKDSKVKEYLNENSLNQAGYEVEIENYNEMDNADVDDYFYAFDKTDWTNKNLFTANHTKQEKKVTISWDASGNPVKTETTSNKTVDVIAYEGDIDGVTAEEYNKKLTAKSKSYNGGLIILADFEAKPDHVGAFSQAFPLDHYMLFVYSTNSSGQTYAHEIGHMLGLEHTFITIDISKNTDNTKEYKDKKQEINDHKINNIEPTKSRIENEKRLNRGKPLGEQIQNVTTFKKGYKVKKSTLINCIDNSNRYFTAVIEYYNRIINDRTQYSSYTWANQRVTKQVFIDNCRKEKNNYVNYKKNNDNSKIVLQNLSNSRFIDFKNEFDIISEDCLKIFEDYLKELQKEWQQLVENFLYFTQNKTKNIMDYTPAEYDVKSNKNIEQCIRFLKHQILIMQKDHENY